MKCWLNGPLSGTPATAQYQGSGETDIDTPLASANRPNNRANGVTRLLDTTGLKHLHAVFLLPMSFVLPVFLDNSRENESDTHIGQESKET